MTMLKKFGILVVLLASILITACGSENDSSKNDQVDKKLIDEGDGYVAASVLEENKKIESMTEEELEEAYKKEPASSRPIRVNMGGAYCVSNIALAEVMGYYEEEGLEAEVIKSPDSMESISTGKIDVGATHVAHILKPTTNGLDISFMGGCNTGCQSFYVLKDSPVETLEDLKGSTLGVSGGIGGPGHNIVMTMFAADGLKAEDYNFLDFEGSQLIIAAENGEIGGFLAPDQLGEKWLDDGKLKRIRSITYDDDFKTDTCCIWMTNGTFRKENPVTSYKLSRAIHKMNEYMEANTPETVKKTMELGWVAGDEDYNVKVSMPLDMDPSISETERTLVKSIGSYKEMGIIDEKLDTLEFMQKYWKPFHLD